MCKKAIKGSFQVFFLFYFILFSSLFLLSPPIFSEDIPDLSDQAKKNEWANYLVKILPKSAKALYSKDALLEFLSKQETLIQNLKSQDKDYEKKMSEKPGPFVIKLYRRDAESDQSESSSNTGALQRELAIELTEVLVAKGKQPLPEYFQREIRGLFEQVIGFNLPGIIF